jgi:hypothetical protein
MPKDVFMAKRYTKKDSHAVRSYRDIAEELGIDRHEVRNIEQRAFRKIRKQLNGWRNYGQYERCGDAERFLSESADWCERGLSDVQGHSWDQYGADLSTAEHSLP